MDALERAGVTGDRIDVMAVPGAFELPLAAMALAKTRRFNCIVALGCVIRGDTPHFDYVCSEAASGIQLAGLETGVPVSFGVLTCDTREQAEERSGGARGNKGAEAVRPRSRWRTCSRACAPRPDPGSGLAPPGEGSGGACPAPTGWGDALPEV